MNYLFLIFFGLAPSIIWLLFYLRKDVHPESNRMILKIFAWGMIMALPIALLELGFFEEAKSWKLPSPLVQILYVFIGVSLTEEVVKYLIIKKEVLKDPEFDEPIDAMLYMIIAALGFAASENLLILFSSPTSSRFIETFLISGFRFMGATFLHTLCSGMVGYFLALSFFRTQERLKLITQGLILAVILHGFYNFSIMKIEGLEKFIIPIIILVVLTFFVSLGFKRLKKLKSICQLPS